MCQFRKLLVAIVVLIGCLPVCLADDLEASRTYGKTYVNPIAVGQFPPVCVTKDLCGREAKHDVKTMRDPNHPSIVVFCKDIDSDSLQIMSSLNSSSQRMETPLFVYVTLQKGVVDDTSHDFDPSNYLQPDEFAVVADKHKQLISAADLSRATVGIAVNRFWRDSIGYTQDADIIVAYVRENVMLIRKMQSSKCNDQFKDEMITSIERLHLESNSPALTK